MLTWTTGSSAAPAWPSVRAAAARAATVRPDRAGATRGAANTGAGAGNKAPFDAGVRAASSRSGATRVFRGCTGSGGAGMARRANTGGAAGRSTTGVEARSPTIDGAGACCAALAAALADAGATTCSMGATGAAAGCIDVLAGVALVGATPGTA
ncbi:hypothetical protein GCM10009121_28880 [Rhodanobacter soli]